MFINQDVKTGVNLIHNNQVKVYADEFGKVKKAEINNVDNTHITINKEGLIDYDLYHPVVSDFLYVKKFTILALLKTWGKDENLILQPIKTYYLGLYDKNNCYYPITDLKDGEIYAGKKQLNKNNIIMLVTREIKEISIQQFEDLKKQSNHKANKWALIPTALFANNTAYHAIAYQAYRPLQRTGSGFAYFTKTYGILSSDGQENNYIELLISKEEIGLCVRVLNKLHAGDFTLY